ncbi:hypothetical protein V6N13_060057 [Hibiscus sabdariffa]
MLDVNSEPEASIPTDPASFEPVEPWMVLERKKCPSYAIDVCVSTTISRIFAKVSDLLEPIMQAVGKAIVALNILNFFKVEADGYTRGFTVTEVMTHVLKLLYILVHRLPNEGPSGTTFVLWLLTSRNLILSYVISMLLSRLKKRLFLNRINIFQILSLTLTFMTSGTKDPTLHSTEALVHFILIVHCAMTIGSKRILIPWSLISFK